MSLQYADIAVYIEAGKSDAEIAAILAAEPPARWFRPLPSIEALAWLAQQGRMAVVEAAAGNDQTPVALRAALQSLLIALRRTDTALELWPGGRDRPAIDGCVAAGIFEGGDVDALIAGTRLVEPPTAGQVTHCRVAYELQSRLNVAINAGREQIQQGASGWAIVRDAIVAAGDGWTPDGAGGS